MFVLSGMRYEDDDEGQEIKALIQIHTRQPDKLNLQDPEDKRRLGWFVFLVVNSSYSAC